MRSFKHNLIRLFGGISVLMMACLVLGGEAPVIESLSNSGELISTNLKPGSTAVVEWASSVEGPWTNTWAGLESVTVDSNGAIRVSVPMFYRVRGVPTDPDPVALVWIQPGTFTMGSSETEAHYQNDEPQHEVTIKQGFWMGRHEVTQGEYLELVGINPSFGTNGSPARGSGGPVTNQLIHPVEAVNWFEATNYCSLLTERERSLGRLPEGYVYRLPTEAEWEYACRAGTTTSHHYGDELRSGTANFHAQSEYDALVGHIANPDGIYLGRTTEVESYEPNAWGLYDMHGNVLEWCLDWYGPYPAGPATDPTGPQTGSYRTLRGGHWYSFGGPCRSANRFWNLNPDHWFGWVGFRVVLAAE